MLSKNYKKERPSIREEIRQELKEELKIVELELLSNEMKKKIKDNLCFQ